jgi:hypothetical protein
MIASLDQVTESRLCWPETKPRAAQRGGSPFVKTEIDRESQRIDDELGRWRIKQYIVSRNNQRIFAGDPAAALWWLDRRGELRVLACDKYQKLSDNLHAIYLTLDAMRALERWGAYTAEQAAEGARLALPPPPQDTIDWPAVLGVERTWPLGAIEAVWKTKVEKAHPDRGGSHEAMAALNAAMQAARKELVAAL